jgi:hypothetical protein
MANKRILLVEGKDDEHVFRALFGKHNLPQPTIHQHEGYPRLLEAIPERLKESDVEAVGIVLDADTSLQGRWEAVRHRLVAAGYVTTPAEPDALGLVLTPPVDTILPRVGVWLMPNNMVPGILEDFLRYLVPHGNALFGYAEQTVNGIAEDLRLFPPVDTPKALIHTWLAWQKEPGKPLGLSITAGFLKHTAPEAETIINWTQRLFFQ